MHTKHNLAHQQCVCSILSFFLACIGFGKSVPALIVVWIPPPPLKITKSQIEPRDKNVYTSPFFNLAESWAPFKERVHHKAKQSKFFQLNWLSLRWIDSVSFPFPKLLLTKDLSNIQCESTADLFKILSLAHQQTGKVENLRYS